MISNDQLVSAKVLPVPFRLTLVSTLDRAVSLPERHAAAHPIRKDLHLDVSRSLEPSLEEDLVVAE